jgi:hypothetical protein
MDRNGRSRPPPNGNVPQGADTPPPTVAVVLNLRQKLAQIRREVGYIQKRGRNEAQNYSYAMAADVAGVIGDRLAALDIILGRNNLSVKRTERTYQGGAETVVEVTLDYQLIDGDSNEVLTIASYGEGRDRGDKAPYKALTGALKYALIQTFLIATGDDPEGEGLDDGRASADDRKGAERRVTSEEARILMELVERSMTEIDRMLEYFGVSRVEEMNQAACHRAVRMLRRKLSKRPPAQTTEAHA